MMGCRDDATKVHRVYFTSCPIAFGKWIANIKKSHCTICTTALWRGKVQKVQKVQGKKMTVQIFIQAAKMEEDFFLSKITKNDSKILIPFTKDTKAIKVHVYKKCT